MQGGELGEPDVPEGGDGVDPDQVLVAGVGGRPDPAPCVGEPFLEVAIERGVLVFTQDLSLDHRTATLALVGRTSNGCGRPPRPGRSGATRCCRRRALVRRRSSIGLVLAPRFPKPCGEVRFLPGAPKSLAEQALFRELSCFG